MASLLPVVKHQFIDNNRNPVPFGKLYSYRAGTSTPLATCTDQSGLTANANPLILDSNGVAEVWLGQEAYKLVLKTADDVVIWTEDNVAGLDNGSVITIKIADLAVTTPKLADGSITTAKLADGNVTANKILDGAVTVNKIPDAEITQAKLKTQVDGTTLEIASNVLRVKDAGVTNAKIAANAVSKDKLVALGQQVSSSCGSAAASGSFADVPNMSVTITTTGRPVVICVIPDGTTSDCYISVTVAQLRFQILRGATLISTFGPFWGRPTTGSALGQYQIPATTLFTIDPSAPAGTYTYKLQSKLDSGSTGSINNAKLVAFEL